MPPAARIGDMHTCPMVTPGTPPVPHVGGPITVGCPTVMIGGQPAARMGDMATCVGPPDSIAKGSPTVVIGMMPAARMGDLSMHGGTIVFGFPTVMIGEAGAGAPVFPVVLQPDGSIRYGNHIVIRGTPEFQSQVLNDLAVIAATPSTDPTRGPQGLATLNNVNSGPHDVVIQSTTGGNVTSPNGPGQTSPGVGTGTVIDYNRTPLPTSSPGVNRPGDVALHHELSHAGQMSHGTDSTAPATNPNNPDLGEENTIADDNRYRSDRSPTNETGPLPQRADHTTL